jgi:hypothetical protein
MTRAEFDEAIRSLTIDKARRLEAVLQQASSPNPPSLDELLRTLRGGPLPFDLSPEAKVLIDARVFELHLTRTEHYSALLAQATEDHACGLLDKPERTHRTSSRIRRLRFDAADAEHAEDEPTPGRRRRNRSQRGGDGPLERYRPRQPQPAEPAPATPSKPVSFRGVSVFYGNNPNNDVW